MGRLQYPEVIVWLVRLLFFDIFLPYLVRHVATRCHPIPPRPQVLAPVALPQLREFRQQLVRAFPLQELYRPRYRQLRRYPNQQMDVVSVDRTRIDNHFLATRNFPQQLSAAQANVSQQHRITVFRHPYQVVFAVPNRMASAFVIFHASILDPPPYPCRLKARDLRIPYRGL